MRLVKLLIQVLPPVLVQKDARQMLAGGSAYSFCGFQPITHSVSRLLGNASPETIKIRFWQIGNLIRYGMGLANKN